MTSGLPSLNVIFSLLLDEREKQLEHFDSLDAKAGIVLGFAGILVALSVGSPTLWGLLGLLLGLAAVGAALSAFWPRGFPMLNPKMLRRYVVAEERFTKLTVSDTLVLMLEEARQLVGVKARRLKAALVFLALSAAALGAGWGSVIGGIA